MTEALRHSAEALLHRYLAACEARDIPAITDCFALRAIVVDPTAPRALGRRAVGHYFLALYADLADLTLTTSPIYWQSRTAACHWQGRARRHDGQVIDYQGVDVFDFDGTPLIARMRAFWDPKDFV